MRIVGVSTLLIGSLLGLPAFAQAAGTAIVIQESNGFPGSEKTNRLARQRVTVQGNHMQVLDRAHAWAMFVDLDKRLVQEVVDLPGKKYVQRPFAAFKKYRDQRIKTLDDQKDEFVRGLKRRKGDVEQTRRWKNEYRKIGGDPEAPGKIVARLQHYPGDTKAITIRINGIETKVKIQHYVIRENQANRPVFDLWVTEDVKVPVDLFRFYRELGTFSAQVSKKLQKLKGKTIIDCTAVLDTGSMSKTFRSRVLEVRTTEVPLVAPVLPAGFVRVAPNAKPKPKAVTRTCAVCKTTIKEGQEVRFREPWSPRRTHYTCSSAHRKQLIQELVKRRTGK